jgi:hypothetical protein
VRRNHLVFCATNGRGFMENAVKVATFNALGFYGTIA